MATMFDVPDSRRQGNRVSANRKEPMLQIFIWTTRIIYYCI